jgi:hypothetical protein
MLLQRTYLRFIEKEATAKRARGTDSPWRLVDGEAGWWVGIKRGVSPPLEYFTIFKVDSQQSAQAESSNHSGKGPQLESDRRNLNQI